MVVCTSPVTHTSQQPRFFKESIVRGPTAPDVSMGTCVKACVLLYVHVLLLFLSSVSTTRPNFPGGVLKI